MAEQDLHTLINSTLPKTLNDLMASRKNIDQIAVYCKTAYETDPGTVFQQTQKYTRDALSNVAYHIHAVGLHLTNFLQLQANEIEKIDLQIQTLTDRMKSAHDNTGASGFRTMESVKKYQSKPKLRKLEGNEIPESSRTLPKYVRQPINLKALDNVGIDLSGNKGTETFATATSRPPSSLAPPPSLNAPTLTQTHSFSDIPPLPRMMAPPPPLDFAPPPPLDFAPPPPIGFMPPPLDDLPPPPPPRDL